MVVHSWRDEMGGVYVVRVGVVVGYWRPNSYSSDSLYGHKVHKQLSINSWITFGGYANQNHVATMTG